MALALSVISSPGGSRDIALDLTDVLEASELVTGTPTAVSSDDTVLQIASVDKNGSIITKDDGDTIQVEKGVVISIDTVKAANTNIKITVYFTGDAGTAETYVVTIPVQTPSLTS